MAKLSPLGRGLDELFADTSREPTEKVTHIEISEILPDENQHRKHFDEAALEELSDSIREHGVLQPILLRPIDGGKYRIVAGERRYRASLKAGLSEMPAIVKELSDSDAAEIALIENLQREDLNPIEEAMGYKSLMDDFSLTQEEAAKRVGKARSGIANMLRLLNLPASAQGLLRDGVITTGHAKVLLGVKDEAAINDLLCELVKNDWSVRELEDAVKRLRTGSDSKPKKKTDSPDEVTLEHFRELENRAGTALGRRVKFAPKSEGNGTFTVEYFDSDDLEELLEALCGEDFFI